jgi:superfamily II DNA or RNA helicase
MARFIKGDRVVQVNTNERAIITKVFPPARGRQMYEVSIFGSNDKVANWLESNIDADVDLGDLFERCKHNVYGSYLDYGWINTSYKIHNTSKNTISSLKASRTIFKAYQFKPLLKFLNSDDQRLLIADEVGLGKTIEAGHIMLELMARNDFKNALIICPKSIQEKWEMELKEKFGFYFKIYRNKKDLVSDLKNNDGHVHAIINYESIRIPKDKEKKNNLIDLLQSSNKSFDFVLCDEAHRLRNDTTLAYKGAKIILDGAKYSIFLTATPIMIGEENLFSLLSLLDSNRYNNKDIFLNDLSVNSPFILALGDLNNRNVSLASIASKLDSAEVSINYEVGEKYVTEYKSRSKLKDLFVDVPLYQNIINRLLHGTDTPQLRVELQYDLSSLSTMNNIFSRTRKRDITTDWTQAEREPLTKIVELYPDERDKFENVINQYYDDNSYRTEWDEERVSPGAALGLIQRKRMVSSSVYAYLNEENDLDKGIDKFEDFEDAKLEKLLEIINKVVVENKNKIIIFALFRKTLKYLSLRLKKKGFPSLIIHGGVENRDDIIKQFKADESISILLSSEVGSEGIDLQFCESMVNYDLPWNPMVVEQRIGRIDRFGQKSSIVHIYNLIVKDSIQEEIYLRLLDRIDIFRRCIGDLEAILDKDLEKNGVRNIQEWFSKLEKELYTTKLSKEEKEEKMNNIAQAIIKENNNLKDVSEGLTDTLTNDMYFKNEINRILENNKYVTSQELINYIRAIIRSELTTCQLVDLGNDIYQIVIPQNQVNTITNFLTSYQPSGIDNDINFRRYINKIRGQSIIDLTFSQEVAFNDPNISYVNAYHPLVLAALEYFDSNTATNNNRTFKITVKQSAFKDEYKVSCGVYILATYLISYEKKLFGKIKSFELLIPVIYDVNHNTCIKDRDFSDYFMGVVQINADNNNEIIKDLSFDDLRVDLQEEIEIIQNEYKNDQMIRLNSSKELHRQRTTEYYDNKIRAQEKIIAMNESLIEYRYDENKSKNAERILPAQRSNLMQIESDKELALKQIEEETIIGKSPELLSLNIVTIK